MKTLKNTIALIVLLVCAASCWESCETDKVKSTSYVISFSFIDEKGNNLMENVRLKRPTSEVVVEDTCSSAVDFEFAVREYYLNDDICDTASSNLKYLNHPYYVHAEHSDLGKLIIRLSQFA